MVPDTVKLSSKNGNLSVSVSLKMDVLGRLDEKHLFNYSMKLD
jgi:hypothetical protein